MSHRLPEHRTVGVHDTTRGSPLMLIASMESKWVMAVLIGENFSIAVASLVRLKQRDQEIAATQGMFTRLGRGSLEVFPEAYAPDRRARPEAVSLRSLSCGTKLA